MQLSKSDWFELYGLHEVATKGACKTSPPPWWTHKPRCKWQAWHAQGNLTPAEARVRFVEAITKVPGFTISESSDGCSWFTDLVTCSGWMSCFQQAAPAEEALYAPSVVEESKLVPDVLVEAAEKVTEAATKVSGAVGSMAGAATDAIGRALPKPLNSDKDGSQKSGLGLSGVQVSPPLSHAKMDEMAGQWEQQHVEGLEPYLKRLGVGWAQRQAALTFKPKQSWTLEGGVLKMSMATPVRKHIETFPLNAETEEQDLSGKSFLKFSKWEAGALVASSRAQDGSMSDVLAKRWIDPKSGVLVQQTTYQGITYTRIFGRVHGK